MIADAATTLQPQAGYPEVEAESAIPFRFRLNGLKDPLDPRTASDPEARADPDDALLKLTTAAEVAQAVDDREHTPDIVELVRHAAGATRWTKLGAIGSIAALQNEEARWQRIWEFARDPDYRVRRAASEEIQRSAEVAYEALQEGIVELILRAAARS